MPLTVEQSTEFRAWHEGLKDERAQRRIMSRIGRVRDGLLGDTDPWAVVYRN
jgi:putative component of toxin-antitoxin plasmid stabilization module